VSKSRVNCKFLQDGLDVVFYRVRKFKFSDLNNVEGSLWLLWKHILQKLVVKFMMLRLALLGVVESECAFKDLADLNKSV
jgi:hypothetical protein